MKDDAGDEESFTQHIFVSYYIGAPYIPTEYLISIGHKLPVVYVFTTPDDFKQQRRQSSFKKQ
jgi:hypothetical protein